jgi:hypothetical protein
MTCAHCEKAVDHLRPRGLCFACYEIPERRRLYPSTYDYGTRPLPACVKCGHPNAGRWKVCSTCRRPAFEQAVYHARIAVYEERAALGLPLFGEVA